MEKIINIVMLDMLLYLVEYEIWSSTIFIECEYVFTSCISIVDRIFVPIYALARKNRQ